VNGGRQPSSFLTLLESTSSDPNNRDMSSDLPTMRPANRMIGAGIGNILEGRFNA
jgi:hypothetical protein